MFWNSLSDMLIIVGLINLTRHLNASFPKQHIAPNPTFYKIRMPQWLQLLGGNFELRFIETSTQSTSENMKDETNLHCHILRRAARASPPLDKTRFDMSV